MGSRNTFESFWCQVSYHKISFFGEDPGAFPVLNQKRRGPTSIFQQGLIVPARTRAGLQSCGCGFSMLALRCSAILGTTQHARVRPILLARAIPVRTSPGHVVAEANPANLGGDSASKGFELTRKIGFVLLLVGLAALVAFAFALRTTMSLPASLWLLKRR